VEARPTRDLFWDEGFAWGEPAEPDDTAVTLPAAAPLSRQAALRARREARRREAARRRRRRLYPLLGSIAALAIISVVLARGGESDAPVERAAAPATPPPPAATPAPVVAAPARETAKLEPGDEGEAVRALQQALATIGFDPGNPDGSFADATRDAVIAFQQDRGLTSDGIVGPETAGELVEALAAEAGEDGASAQAALAEAANAGALSADAARRYSAAVDEALTALAALPLRRAANLALVLDDVAAHADVYDAQRTLTLFTMLETNTAHFAQSDPPARSADVEGDDATVYRFFRARGFQFHPIANFATLNGHVANGRREDAERLARSLVARGVPEGDALVWEYFFAFGGPRRWASGFAQALAADALSRAGRLLGDEELVEAARKAFAAIPETLSMPLGGGAWIREYGFSDIAILNAQLQTLISLMKYAEAADDDDARAFAAELETASRTLLPQFDRGGCWSLYSLGGGPAPPSYHRYHIALLEQLAELTGESPWAETARRWKTACA
jgi:peptidoglycan hydrolase-like protein with peptidoglycan-binding domain